MYIGTIFMPQNRKKIASVSVIRKPTIDNPLCVRFIRESSNVAAPLLGPE